MPPPNELKARVDFVYSEDSEMQAEKFWKKEAKKENDKVESFIGKRKAMEQTVAQIVSPSNAPEVKLQKIYARVQQVRNTGYEVRLLGGGGKLCQISGRFIAGAAASDRVRVAKFYRDQGSAKISRRICRTVAQYRYL